MNIFTSIVSAKCDASINIRHKLRSVAFIGKNLAASSVKHSQVKEPAPKFFLGASSFRLLSKSIHPFNSTNFTRPFAVAYIPQDYKNTSSRNSEQ